MTSQRWITEVLGKLEDEGYIMRVVRGRRTTRIALTPKGRAVFEGSGVPQEVVIDYERLADLIVDRLASRLGGGSHER